MDAKRNARADGTDGPAGGPLGEPARSEPAGAAGVPRDVVVIGASAGGVEALKAVLGALPPDYDGTVYVVLHIPPSVPSVLAHILGRSTHLVCVSASDGAPVRPGVLYVAPPDSHLLLEDGRVCLVRGPRENGHRPAIDPLFRSAAEIYGERVVGVVLTGNLDDGTRGLFAIKRRGGFAVAQAPEDALYPSMPQNAIAHVGVDRVLPARDIGPLLAALAVGAPLSAAVDPFADAVPAHGVPAHAVPADDGVPARAGAERPDALTALTAVVPVLDSPPYAASANGAGAAGDAGADASLLRAADLATGIGEVNEGARINERLGGTVSGYTCPECHGALWELREGRLVRYRCRVGHSYTEPGLVDHKARAVEDAIWTALTALEESAAIAARVADRSDRQGRAENASIFRARAQHLEQRGAVLRDLLGELPGHVDAA